MHTPGSKMNKITVSLLDVYCSITIRATEHVEISFHTLKHHMCSCTFGSCRANSIFIEKERKVSERLLGFWQVSNTGKSCIYHAHSMDKVSIVNFQAMFYTGLEITVQNYY